MAGAVLNEREGAEAVRGARRVGWGRAVFGSACLWAWGFLAYLSPVLIPAERPVGGVGIEVGFFVSQGAVVVAAVAIVLALRKRSVAVGRGVLLVCASLLALASALLPLTVAIDAPWPLVGCGAICGVAGTLLGCAWGARYSLESRECRQSSWSRSSWPMGSISQFSCFTSQRPLSWRPRSLLSFCP